MTGMNPDRKPFRVIAAATLEMLAAQDRRLEAWKKARLESIGRDVSPDRPEACRGPAISC